MSFPFFRMKEIAEDIKPFIEDQYVMDDVYRIIVAFQSMDIFKNLGLLDMKCMISLRVSSRKKSLVTFDSVVRRYFYFQTLSEICSTTGMW